VISGSNRNQLFFDQGCFRSNSGTFSVAMPMRFVPDTTKAGCRSCYNAILSNPKDNSISRVTFLSPYAPTVAQSLRCVVADYGGTGLMIGKHPMHYRRQALCRQGMLTASELQKRRNGEYVKTAGFAIVKQRPGTAKGVVFMSAAGRDGNLQHHREQGLF
jgi:hypothetical protein